MPKSFLQQVAQYIIHPRCIIIFILVVHKLVLNYKMVKQTKKEIKEERDKKMILEKMNISEKMSS